MRTPGEPFRVVLDGVMHEIWHQPLLTPLFQMLGRLGVLVPVTGRNVPTRLLVRPGKTAAGQPFHVFDRSFDVDPPVRFRTTIVYDPHIDHLVELVGPRNALYMVWDARFEPPLMFTLDSAAIALQLGNRRIWLPDWFWP
ncbi:MAG: DUF4166 domain-containing protein, partial [Candidatus Limnocylindria bacterium]